MPPDTYRKYVATAYSTNFREVAQIVEVETPQPAPDELLVRNLYAGVNASDVVASNGLYTPGVQPPFDLGAEAIGEVAAIGAQVTSYKVGDFVMSFGAGVGYREYHVVKERFAIPVPQATPEILSLIVSGVTASIGLSVTGEMKSGETVLVTAAAGGTGQFAVQLAKLVGNQVIGTCGSDEKAELLRSLGCDRPINYRTEDVRAVLKNEYPRGINLIYESVGGGLFDICVDNLARQGRLVIIGVVSDYVKGPQIVTRPRIGWDLLTKSASLRGMFLPHFIKLIPEHLLKLSELYRSGQLKVEIDPTEFIGLEFVPHAVDYLHSGQSLGKVVVKL